MNKHTQEKEIYQKPCISHDFSLKSLIIPVGSPAVHPELLCGDTESYQIEQSSNPAVEGVLIISVLDIFSQHVDVGVRFFLQTNVLDESHTDGGNVII